MEETRQEALHDFPDNLVVFMIVVMYDAVPEAFRVSQFRQTNCQVGVLSKKQGRGPANSDEATLHGQLDSAI